MINNKENITCVEFFDITPVENICVSLSGIADKVILFAANNERMTYEANNYRKFIKSKNLKTIIEIKCVSLDNMSDIVKALENIVIENSSLIESDENKICIFDLTGGLDLNLVAAGIVYEKYRKSKKIQMHRYNLDCNNVKDILLNCDEDNKTYLENTLPVLSVSDFFTISGAIIKNQNDWNLNTEFLNDIEYMWSICSKEPEKWNKQIIKFQKIEDYLIQQSEQCGKEYIYKNSELIKINLNNICNIFKESYRTGKSDFKIKSLITEPDLVEKLKLTGLIKSIDINDGYLIISFKNKDIKKCLVNAGRLLELKIYSLTKLLKDENGEYVYNDVLNSVEIDWDGDLNKETKNEIDIMAMHIAVPVYISCKNGWFDAEEMYKLNTVAGKFGKRYAKKVIMATNMGNKKKKSYIEKKERSENMGINLIDISRKCEKEKIFTGEIKEKENKLYYKSEGKIYVKSYESLEKYNNRLLSIIKELWMTK